MSFGPERALRLVVLAAFTWSSTASAAGVERLITISPATTAVSPSSISLPVAPQLLPVLPLAAALSRNAPPPIAVSPTSALQRLAQPAKGENFAALLDQYFSGNLSEPGAQESPLEAERPLFTHEEIETVKRRDEVLTRAVEQAARATFHEFQPGVKSRGSTSRLTHDNVNPDYDIGVKLPEKMTAGELSALLAERGTEFRKNLMASLRSRVGELFPGQAFAVEADPAVSLTDAANHKITQDAKLYHVRVLTQGGERLAVDVSVTRSAAFANPYPKYFARQLAQITTLAGPDAAGQLISDIRLAKLFFKRSVRAYKFYEGGPSAVGVEQLVMQSGHVSNRDRGATIIEPGSFTRMMSRLHDASHDETGRMKTFKEFEQAWTVHSPYAAPANFLSLMRRSYERVAAATRLYREAALAGRPVKLEELRSRARAPSVPSPVQLIRSDAKTSPRSVEIVLQRLGGTNFFKRTVQMLQNRLANGSQFNHVPGSARTSTLKITVPNGVAPQTQVKQILKFFAHYRFAAKLVSVTYADAPTPSETQAPEETTAPLISSPESAPVEVERGEPLGELTQGLLDRFSTAGPKPSTRGADFLLAQGAATLPHGWVDSWTGVDRESDARRPAGRDVQSVRALLLRRGKRTYVAVRVVEDNGREFTRQIDVPSFLTQGIVSDTLVDFKFDSEGALSVRPIGAFPQDMMIGRVVERAGKTWLEGLFRDDGAAVSLYHPMPLTGDVRGGSIVSAFIRPEGRGYSAAVVTNLGNTITPEIAAREIALRRGARGFFEPAVVAQAEAAARNSDPEREYAALQAKMGEDSKFKTEDLRKLPFITIDPPGAGDLDDAFFVEKHDDGSFTWLLATANVAHYVKPGTPAFRSAARVGNTFYSIDKEGVSEYPMNHPVVSKNLASLLDAKDSLAMITRMEFDAQGHFSLEKSGVSLGLIRVQGRYTYDQVADMWRGGSEHGVRHASQVNLARELAKKLSREDDKRGKMNLTLERSAPVKRDGVWSVDKVVEDPLMTESHRLIEELKVYGNREIAVILEEISRRYSVPHISRVHPEQKERFNERLRDGLKEIGVPWTKGTIPEYLNELQARPGLREEVKQVAQWLVLTTRQSALYAADDAEGHEGLALTAGQYDHPSAPIRRFSDMYNRALLESFLEGGNPRETYAKIEGDLKSLGFKNLDDYLSHLNGREQATRQMDYEVEAFMSLVELSKPQYLGKPLEGYVRFMRGGRNPSATIELKGTQATLVLNGEAAAGLALLDNVSVVIRAVDLERRSVDAEVSQSQSTIRADSPARSETSKDVSQKGKRKAGRGKGDSRKSRRGRR